MDLLCHVNAADLHGALAAWRKNPRKGRPCVNVVRVQGLPRKLVATRQLIAVAGAERPAGVRSYERKHDVAYRSGVL